MIIQGKLPGTSRPLNVLMENGIIVRVESPPGAASPDFGGTDFYVSGGFFDPQVNGFAGVDFNREDLTPESFHRAARALAGTGVTRFLPTLVTAPLGRTVHLLKILSQARKSDPLAQRMCPGFHLEGPYISPEEGFRGAHMAGFIRPPSWEEAERLQEAAEGCIRCITLAPEVEGAIPFIEKAVKNRIVIGLAHTNAAENIFDDALKAGARLSCHLGNGIRDPLPRHRNPIQKQLSMDGLLASIIADGIHLPAYVVKNFIRAKGPERILLTTDSMAGAGGPPGRYPIGDLEVEVGKGDSAARLPGTPYLAGSTLAMDRAVNNVLRFTGFSLEAVLQMAGTNAEKLFPEAQHEIAPGGPADVVLFKYQDGEVKIEAAWIGGEKILPQPSPPPRGRGLG